VIATGAMMGRRFKKRFLKKKNCVGGLLLMGGKTDNPLGSVGYEYTSQRVRQTGERRDVIYVGGVESCRRARSQTDGRLWAQASSTMGNEENRPCSMQYRPTEP
jgi:hypothetical protein